MTKPAANDQFQQLNSPEGELARIAFAFPNRSPMVLHLGRDGMFWNVNRLINCIYVAKSFRRDFLVSWENSLYYQKGIGSENTWLSYFRQPFPNRKRGSNRQGFHAAFSAQTIRGNRITESRLSDSHNIKGLGLPADKLAANSIIKQHIVLRPNVLSMVNKFISTFLDGPVIGLHIRGLGRNAGATFELRHFLGDQEDIPFQTYFNRVDEALEHIPSARVFACSDSADVIQVCKQRYGKKLITYDAIRTDFGEMHTLIGQDGNLIDSPYKLGLDIIIEAYALSSCDYFVHGNSNVSNFVLCNSPQMPHRYIFDEAQKAYVEWAIKNIGNSDEQKKLTLAKKKLEQNWPGSLQRVHLMPTKERVKTRRNPLAFLKLLWMAMVKGRR